MMTTMIIPNMRVQAPTEDNTAIKIEEYPLAGLELGSMLSFNVLASVKCATSGEDPVQIYTSVLLVGEYLFQTVSLTVYDPTSPNKEVISIAGAWAVVTVTKGKAGFLQSFCCPT